MPKQPPWEIRVGRKAEILGEFKVPAHKLQKKALAAFLKALVVRYSTDTPEEMLTYYVNETAGKPNKSMVAEPKWCPNLERRRVGYWCGDWECYAVAMQEIDAASAEALLKLKLRAQQ